ncbi:MAG: 50S ribosomal protein L11 methyltransferase, partial [Gammaproteobacteria bacterium]|nr:50S ribosomal protein L11 methyltransferase [Gammaproteobacteria bacterium]
MSWQQLHLQLNSSDIDAISDALHELGAVAVTMMDAEDNPIFEPPLGTTPLWDQTQLTGLFDISRDLDTVLAELASRFGNKVIIQSRK